LEIIGEMGDFFYILTVDWADLICPSQAPQSAVRGIAAEAVVGRGATAVVTSSVGIRNRLAHGEASSAAAGP
jgi:hypothetical protein